MRATVATLAMLSLVGCGSDDETTAVPPAGCAAGEWPGENGGCVAPGLPPDMPCPPAESLRDDGACVAAGVPPDGCGQGFVHDGDRGCEPVLPTEACAPGLMAVPGETSCHEVAPCAPGRWGDIPVEPDTEHVDASYAGLDSDGSALKPWTAIQDGVDAAAPGAIVAIAAGSYLEDVTALGKMVRIWGVCPALVEVVGTGDKPIAMAVFPGASGSEVRALAIRGAGIGAGVTGALDVVFDRVWVHDTMDVGVTAQDIKGPASATLRASLVESTAGAIIAGAEVTLEGSVVRDSQLAPGHYGRGIAAVIHPDTGSRSKLVLRSSLVERNHDAGVHVSGGEAIVEGSVVRATGTMGRGLNVQSDSMTGEPANLAMRGSLVAQNDDIGVFLSGANAMIETSVIRDTQLDAGGSGRGVNAQDDLTGTPSTLALRASLVERSHEFGVFVLGSQAIIEASVVRDTQPQELGLFGRGVSVEPNVTTGARSTLALSSSLVERNYEIGVFVGASDATLEACIVRDTQPNALGAGGRGINAQADAMTGAPSTLTVHATIVEHSAEAGIAVLGSSAVVDGCLVSDSHPSPALGAGDGIIVVSNPQPASATITATRIEQSTLAAIAAWGGSVGVGRSALACQAFDIDTEVFDGHAAELEDLGDNTCGCEEVTATCKAVTAALTPPAPLEAAPE